MVFMKEFFKKNDVEKNKQKAKKHEKIPRGAEYKYLAETLVVLGP